MADRCILPRIPCKGRAYGMIEQWLAQRCEAILFESAFARDGFERQFGLSAAHWPIIHNGLAPDEFTDSVLASDAADFVFIGEMRAIKGVDILLSALAALPDKPSLVLIGSGPEKDAYQALADALGVASQLRFLDAMPARQAFSKGRVVVAPSRAESLPYLLLEALAAGKQVLATQVGGIPEIFGPQQTQLIPAGDVAALTHAMAQALCAPNHLASQYDSLRTHIKNEFALAKMIDAIEAVYCANLVQHNQCVA